MPLLITWLRQLLYTRLAVFKGIAAKLAAEPASSRQPNPVALELGLSSSNNQTSSDNRPVNAEHYYELLLDSCERLFDNEIEQHAFEEQMRGMFGVKVI
jgi:paired amphipathic helix protein Sin3a